MTSVCLNICFSWLWIYSSISRSRFDKFTVSITPASPVITSHPLYVLVQWQEEPDNGLGGGPAPNLIELWLSFLVEHFCLEYGSQDGDNSKHDSSHSHFSWFLSPWILATGNMAPDIGCWFKAPTHTEPSSSGHSNKLASHLLLGDRG